MDLSPSERQRQQQEALKELEPLAPLQRSQSREITEERRELAAYNNSSEVVEGGSSSLPARPSLPPSTNTDRPQPRRPGFGPSDFARNRQRPPLLCLSPTLALARNIDDLESVTYPEGIQTPMELNQGQTGSGNYRYDRNFLLQFMQICKDKPGNFSNLDGLGIERGPGNVSGPSFGSVGRNQRNRMASMDPPSGGRSTSGSIGLGLTGFPSGKGLAPFVMGNFSSTPSRMTNEERFAASNRDRAVTGSGFIRGGAVPTGRSSSQGGVGGTGGPNAVPPSPRERGNRTRSQRGRTRNNLLKPNAPQSSHQQQQQGQAAISRPESAVPLRQPEDRWTPATRSKLAIDENSPEYVERKVKALLNKLTLENFDSVSNQIISWANKSENEKNAATLILVTKLLFEKAIDEELWSEAYARLCRRMMEQISQNVQDDSIRNNAGEPIVGGHLFCKYLLNICLDNFERGRSRKESARAAAALKPTNDKTAESISNADGETGETAVYSDEYYALLKARRQGLGLLRFIGELFKLQIFKERIMHECIKKLLSKIENPEEEEIETLCKLLTTVGQTLDTPRAKGHMNLYFGRIQMLADNPTIGWRIRPKLVYVTELRKRNWRPRNETAGPCMIARIREQVRTNRAMPENVTEERRELAVHNDSSEFVESGSLSLPAEPSLPPSSTNAGRPKAQRPVREPRDFSQVQQSPPLLCLSRTLASARKIDDLDSVTYPEGIKTPVELNQDQTGSGNYRYDRDLLLRFMQVCKDKPGNFSKLDGRRIARGTEDHGGLSLKSVGRSQINRMGSMGAPPGGSPASGSIGLGLTGFPGGTGSAPFVMGNFSSTPSRMTSEERFASTIQDKTVTGSVTIRGGAVSLSRSSDQGGAGGPSAVSSSPSEQPRTRAQRGRTRNSSLKPDALQPSEHEQQQQQAPSGPEQALPVYYPEDRWTPTARRKFVIDENSPEYVERKVRALLNKLTLENFESVSNQIISWANKSENENNAATMALVIKIIFEKAIDEELRSETYARLCVKVVEQISPNVRDNAVRTKRVAAGGHLFRNYLHKRCDDEFERDASKANRENGRPVLYSDEYYTLCKIRRQGLGLVRFIGELFKLHLFTERIIHDFLKKLLSKIDNLGEEIESMCNLLTAVGEALDKPRAKDQMDTYFMKVQMLANNPNIGWRIRHKLLDVIELRQRNWIPRNPAAGPSTITQFFELLIPVKALLHKLSLKNFDSVSSQIISWANKSENEKNGATLILITKLVFEKATDEAHRSEIYARLCRKMMEEISQNVQDDNICDGAGEPILGGNLFRRYLLNRCQEDFERGWSQKESAQAAAALMAADDKSAEDASKANGANGEPALYSDEYYALLKVRHQGLGLVRFIGELFKLQMLTERIMHECIKKLLSKIENPEEEEIESLCKLLTTVGQALDTPKANGHMDIHFSKIQMLADNPNVASRIRNMLLDVIELRQRNWRPKNAAAGLSTIAQARGQGAKKAAKKAAAATQQASKIVPITRGGAQRGGLGQPVQGPDGWNVAGPTPVRAPVKPGDLSNFGKLTASTGPLKTTGPSSTSKKGDRGHNTPSPGSSGSLSRAASGGNIYSLLGAGGADADTMPKRTPRERGTTGKPSADQAPQQAPNTPLHKKLNLSPRAVSSVNTTEDSYGDKNKLESHKKRAAGATKSYTKQELKAKVEEDVKEFFNIRDVREGEKRFAELPDEHKSRLVDKLASKALELQESDVKLVAELFERVASKGCPPSAFEDGLAVIIEFLDDMVIDVPQVYAFMARLLRGARLPQETVDSLGDKIFVDGDPLVKPKDKLLKAYNSLA